MSHPLALLLYVATFALIALLWLVFHRLMSGAFVPTGVDLVLAFAYLALVSLFPFALYDVSHTTQTLALARSAVAQYTTLYATMSAIAATMSMRNLRRGYHLEADADRDRAWYGFIRNSALGVMMAIALGVDLTLGPTASIFVFPFITVAIVVLRRLYPHAPSAGVLRLPRLEERAA
jgi:uncharacterized membrane protein